MRQVTAGYFLSDKMIVPRRARHDAAQLHRPGCRNRGWCTNADERRIWFTIARFLDCLVTETGGNAGRQVTAECHHFFFEGFVEIDVHDLRGDFSKSVASPEGVSGCVLILEAALRGGRLGSLTAADATERVPPSPDGAPFGPTQGRRRAPLQSRI